MIKLEDILKVDGKRFKVYTEGMKDITKDNEEEIYHCPLIDVDSGKVYDYVQVGERYYCGIYKSLDYNPIIGWYFKKEIDKEKTINKDFKDLDCTMANLTYDDVEIEGFPNLINLDMINYGHGMFSNLNFLLIMANKNYKNLYLGITDEVDNKGRTRDKLILEKNRGHFKDMPFIIYVSAMEGKDYENISIDTYNEYKNKFNDKFKDLKVIKELAIKRNEDLATLSLKERAKIIYEITNSNKVFTYFLKDEDDENNKVAIRYDKKSNDFICKRLNSEHTITPAEVSVYIDVALEDYKYKLT